MSSDETFLARWSRRKRDAVRTRLDPPEAQKAVEGSGPSGSPASVPKSETDPAFDPARLPPIESIGAGSDIRAFLVAGVPAELTRAALRRAWSADPAIRDFIGLSENFWDCAAADSAPGFGSMTTEEVRRVLNSMGENTSGAGQPAVSPSDYVPKTQGDAEDQSLKDQDNEAGGETVDPTDPAKETPVTTRSETTERITEPLLSRRGHGSAIPR